MTTLFISDLDGTLLAPDGRLTPKTICKLNESIGKGALFSVATARTPATVSKLLAEVDCRIPLIVMTGAAIWDRERNQYIHACFHNKATALTLASIYKDSGLGTFVYTLGEDNIIHIYHIGRLSDLELKFISERSGTPYKMFHIPADGDSEIPNECFSRVLLFYSMRPTVELERVYDMIKCRPDLRAVFYHDIFGDEIALMEVFSPKASKADAVKILAERCRADYIVAYGDNVNDLPILDMADDAVAVGNAVDSVKNVASRIIGSNAVDSVALDIEDMVRAK
ncbi:MAG: HAD family hydrolase [Muribaculum sp.]|nr:HAD family hydrolase [Muribaculum sp.]